MERFITAFSDRSTEKGQSYSFDDVYEKLSSNGGTPLLILFSSDYDNFEMYSDLMHKRFPDSTVIGSVSFTNYLIGAKAEKALSALAVYEDIECSSGVIQDISRYPSRYITGIRKAYKEICTGPDISNVCCFEITTAYGKGEELVLDTFREVIGEKAFPLFGSSSGVRAGTQRSFVSLNGVVYDEACVYVFIKNLRGRISIVKENTFRSTSHFFSVTNVNCDEHRLYELDGRPAAVQLAAAVGTEIPVLARNIIHHPIGRVYGDRIYIADAEAIAKDASISFYSYIYNYSRVVLLEPDEVNNISERFFGKVRGIGFDPSFSIAVNCAFDYDIYSDMGITGKFLRELSENCGSFWGISGCGEQIDLVHVNKTMILAAFE